MEYYVTLINPNSKELEYYNIFQNAYVAEDIENYKHDWNLLKINRNNLIMVLDQTFHYAYWGRCQYEIIVSDLFDAMEPEKIDAYYQIKPNIPVIADMLIKEWEEERL